MKRTSLLAALMLLVGLLAGCGNSDSSTAADTGSSATDAPADPTVEEFCAVFADMAKQAASQGADTSDTAAIKLLKDLAQKLSDVGTPSDMPEDAAKGVTTLVDKINSVPDDATADDLSAIEDDFTAEEKKNQNAFGDYVTANCVGQLAPSASASPSS
jgi:hypothetical protein